MKIAIVHFRIGMTDGVSLQIDERVRILKALGHDLVYIAGTKSTIADLRIPYFEYKELKNINSSKTLASLADEIEKLITAFWNKEKFSHIFIHNIFSLPVCLPATLAFFNFLKSHPEIKDIAIHHDFWWERSMFHKTKYYFINDILESMPPKKNYIISHQVINSIAKQLLYNRSKIVAEKNIGDFFDFSKKLPEKDEFNSDFLMTFGIEKGAQVILHSTRIVKRKAIENAIVFVSQLKKESGKNTYLLLPNFIEVDSQEYFKKLKSLAEELRVNFIWIGDRVSMERQQQNDRKIYSFWDRYLFADIMTYTSYAEGYGNQLLEAFWAKIIPIIFEYPVFKSDIKKQGYEYISLGDKMRRRNGLNFIERSILREAAKQTVKYLSDKDLYQKATRKNFLLAEKYHDANYLKTNLASFF